VVVFIGFKKYCEKGGDMVRVYGHRVFIFLLSVLIPASLVSCGGGGGGGGGASGSTGTVSVSLSDANILYDQVVLTIKEIGVVTSGSKTVYYNSSQIESLPTSIDVLDFPFEETVHLANIRVPIPEGKNQVCFNQIRLRLAKEGDPDCPASGCNYVIEEGGSTAYELKTPSGQQSGVKILTPNDFCVSDDEDSVKIVVDFDPATAIVHNENSNKNKDKYLLKPTGIRIIEGSWSVAPDSYIDGMVVIPADESAPGECVAFDTDPLVTVAAFDDGTTANPAVQTVTLAEGPVSESDVCTEWCEADADTAGCQAACEAELSASCYYRGRFKLLLPNAGVYDLDAYWDNFRAEIQDVGDQSSVLMELSDES
jgi:hypothetical protein